MKILNIGSLNIDNVYKVDEFVAPGETKTACAFKVNCGGKGLNQSIAAAKAGCEVWHAGLVGNDGQFLLGKLQASGVNTSLVEMIQEKCGHAIIQVNSAGQNCILLYAGTNRMLTEEIVDHIFQSFESGQAVLLQNEVNELPYIIKCAKEHGHLVFLNAAPMDEKILECDLSLVDWLIVNEVEGAYLSGTAEIDRIIPAMTGKFPNMNILLTLGKNGAVCKCKDGEWRIEARKVDAVDTTAAGDTFSGYFIKCILSGEPIENALKVATLASSICVGRDGAADSVPEMTEIYKMMNDYDIITPEATKIG